MDNPAASVWLASANTPATYRRTAFAALMIAHCAGMVDLVALPVWVATLIGGLHLDAQHAGALPTLFLAGVVASSAVCSPLLLRLSASVPARAVVTTGFALAALAFYAAGASNTYGAMAVLHLLAGLAVGCSLSITHGTIGRSANPHRLFAFAGLALGAFSIAFLGATPHAVAAYGARAFFTIVAAVMAVAALCSALAFPSVASRIGVQATSVPKPPLAAPVWFAIAGVIGMALTQAMLASFVARIGVERGFGLTAVTSVLIALGLVNLLPAPLAVLTQRRLSARAVVRVGPLVQAALALTITLGSGFAPYAAATAVFPAVMIFCHTYAFGLLSRLDASGRAAAATPAMVMAGAAAGPLLGGALVKHFGYGSLGYAALVVGALACACFTRLPRSLDTSGHAS
ncbi:putative MFS family arabinose efflux permease [Paraburkholderia bannensis]|uniref:Putative MFS family arabinose efflux permease n=1 Tax=Paraburkholderia bannensis TaxID=765414 RepID=A0A7W9WTA7_9BURK|nr:putative MFS family arabinose efflux permease [Paraburkholderia sp. WP4_3_2]MBB6103152.1 putative MFS family arabinose efflux permease [Paraburkholderia bannensis]